MASGRGWLTRVKAVNQPGGARRGLSGRQLELQAFDGGVGGVASDSEVAVSSGSNLRIDTSGSVIGERSRNRRQQLKTTAAAAAMGSISER